MKIRNTIAASILFLIPSVTAFSQNSPGMPAGNIGIGNASPGNLLHVHNVNLPAAPLGSIEEIANFSGVAPNSSQFKFLLKRHTLSPGGVHSWTEVGSRLQHLMDATSQGYIEFNPLGDPDGIAFGTGSNEQLRIKPNGFIGIGATNPREKFQIGDRITITDGGWKGMTFNMAWDAGLNYNARMVAAPAAAIYFTDLGNLLFQTAPDAAAGTMLTDAVHSMVIHNSGQVGIGTAFTKTGFSDLNYKLIVEGGVKARKVKVDQASWPDYVFDSTYVLLPLNEVENYIRQFKHLPGVTPAAEIEKDGLDLGDNQAILLKKIEELTLYIIAQDKRIQEQEKRMEHQQRELESLKTQLKTSTGSQSANGLK